MTAPPEAPQNLGGAKRAAEIAEVAESTVRGWLKQGLIRGERVGGRYRYNLDDVAAMRVPYPRTGVDERIRELIEGAPEFTAEQISRIRLLLHATPDRAGEGVTGATGRAAGT
jgi:hypothetical protein